MSKTIIAWSIDVQWSDNSIEKITDVDNELAQELDNFLTEFEHNLKREKKTP